MGFPMGSLQTTAPKCVVEGQKNQDGIQFSKESILKRRAKFLRLNKFVDPSETINTNGVPLVWLILVVLYM